MWAGHQQKAWLANNVPAEVVAEFDRAYRAGGYEGGQRWLIQWREGLAGAGIQPSAALAIDYLNLGEKERALYWLERAFQNHTRDLIYLNVEPRYDPIRSEPRFQEIVRRVGLPPVRRPVEARTTVRR